MKNIIAEIVETTIGFIIWGIGAALFLACVFGVKYGLESGGWEALWAIISLPGFPAGFVLMIFGLNVAVGRFLFRGI